MGTRQSSPVVQQSALQKETNGKLLIACSLCLLDLGANNEGTVYPLEKSRITEIPAERKLTLDTHQKYA